MIRVLLIVLSLLIAPAAEAQRPAPGSATEFAPAYPEVPLRGAERAKGALIWSHGLEKVAESAGALPFYADAFRDAGWDVFVLNRRWASDNPQNSSAALGREVEGLKRAGYQRIVLAGQSFGAWLSVMVATQRDDIHAVIATAPAAYGPVGPASSGQLNADQFYKLAENVKKARVMVFLFERDSFDPGGRGEMLDAIFTRRNLPHVIVDRPVGLLGHGVGGSPGFARRFGTCMLTFADFKEVPAGFSCDKVKPAVISRFITPRNMKIGEPPPNAAKGLAAFAGRWTGHFSDGREFLFVPEEFGVDRVIATVSMTKRVRTEQDREGMQRRRGEYNPSTGVLSFTEDGKTPLITVQVRPDSKMDVTLSSRDGKARNATVLQRVD